MPTTDERAVDIVSAMYSAAMAGDMDAVFARIGDDLELHEPPILPYGRVYHGHDGFKEIHAAATAILDMSTLNLDYLFGDEERVCAVVSLGLINGNRTTILEEWQVRDGKIRWGRVFWFNPEAIA